MRYRAVRPLPLLLGIVICCLGLGCSNSERIDNEVVAFWDIEEDATPLSTELNYLPIDDSEYPYAGIPRIVIETENHREIKDRETEIPAKLQVWGADAPESEVMELTIRGRGNSSWTDMPKKSYKIEFTQKQSLLGMPKDRDWALIANYADKTLMKNYLAYNLSAKMDAYYAPRCEFVELYINREYLGVYLLTETIKKAKHRVDISNSENGYLIEIDGKYRKNEQVVFSHEITQDSTGIPFRIHFPKDASEHSLQTIENHIKSFEIFLRDSSKTSPNLNQWIDVDECIKYYWIQEFAKNPDANFHTSVFFSWVENSAIKMGPVWDFDLSFGGYDMESINSPEKWHLKNSYWNSYIFNNLAMKQSRAHYWHSNREQFIATLNAIDSVQSSLNKAAENNFKRWNILQRTDFRYHTHSYRKYKDATDDLKKWIQERIQWIDSHI